MLLYFQTELQQELCSSISNLTNHIDSIEDGIYMFESKLGEIVKAHDELVGAHDEQMETIHKLQLKVADLKNTEKISNLRVSLRQ